MCRDLRADEIDVRVQQIISKGDMCSGLILLLYKNARVDMDILDETFGKFGWQRKHEFKDGRLYCTVSVWDSEKQMWISREDVGTESNTEAEKGQASDSFKRANVNFGIGRELYTAPNIFVTEFTYKSTDRKDKYGNVIFTTKDTFSVSHIKVEKKQITELVIKNDKSGKDVYFFGVKNPTNSRENTSPKQEHVETENKAKTSVEKPQMTYKEALLVQFEGRTLHEIYKTDRKHIADIYEMADANVKKAIEIIEAFIQSQK